MRDAVLIAITVGLGFSLIALVIGIVLRPRPQRDHYAKPLGDYPKVPR